MSFLTTFTRRALAPTSRLVAPVGVKLLDGTIITTTTATRQFSSQPTRHIVISSIGPDRPGILADVARIVTTTGGNVGESTAQLLGGHFSLMMLVEIKSSDMDGLTKQLNDVMGMSTSCFDAVSEKVELSPKIGFAGHFKLSGADNPGIVHKLTSVLAKNSLTIGNMKTSQEDAPFGGSQLFTMEGRAVAYEPLSSNFDWEKIQEELQEMGESINCDVEFEEVYEL